MIKYKEWEKYQLVNDKENPFSNLYIVNDTDSFYIEPAFYTLLTNFKEMYSKKDYERILNKMDELVNQRHKIIFTYDYENPLTHKEGYIYLEFLDITDQLKIIIDDKSRGSDYGD